MKYDGRYFETEENGEIDGGCMVCTSVICKYPATVPLH